MDLYALSKQRRRFDDKPWHRCPEYPCMTLIPASFRVCQFHGRKRCACGGFIDAHAMSILDAVVAHNREPVHIEYTALFEAVFGGKP